MTHIPWSGMSIAEKSAAIAAGVADKLSASQIGARHGVNRNVIIGHAGRYGDKLLPKKVASADKKTLRRERYLRSHADRVIGAPRVLPKPRRNQLPHLPVLLPPSPPKAIPAVPGEGAVTFLSRANDQCSWPLSGRGADMLCCGLDVPPGHGSWCKAHRLIGWGRGTPGERAAHRELARAE